MGLEFERTYIRCYQVLDQSFQIARVRVKTAVFAVEVQDVFRIGGGKKVQGLILIRT